jgi:TPR repeat protein
MMGYFEDCGRKAGDGAARWYSLAAVQGHGQAQLALSLHLQRGSGGARADAKEAEAWMMLARATPDPPADEDPQARLGSPPAD